MRISNVLHFTESHRFYIYRDFSLSTVDYRLLYALYQPMVGSSAVGLYAALYQQIPADQFGFSALEPQMKLFLSLNIEPNEKGRQLLMEQASALEAVGLLQTFRKFLPASDETVYFYHLQPPLNPQEFFKNQHLVLLLRDKVGKHMALALKKEFFLPAPPEVSDPDHVTENVSVPFYEWFRLNTRVIDYELEEAIWEANLPENGPEPSAPVRMYTYADIIMRCPKDSLNRPHIEQLKYKPDQLAAINYIAGKYELSLQQVCRLMDEDGVFTADGELLVDVLKHRANLHYRQDLKREEERKRYLRKAAEASFADSKGQAEEKDVQMDYYLEVPPAFAGQCSVHQYNMMLRNEPYTQVLRRFFPGAVPDHILNIFERIDMHYKLKEEVINVLIHYLKVNQLSWNKRFIDSIVADMLGKQVDSYERAVQYVRERMNWQEKQKTTAASDKRGGQRKSKPQLRIISDLPEEEPLSAEEMEEIRRITRQLDGH